MKKILNILLFLVLIFILSSCIVFEVYVDNIRLIIYVLVLIEFEVGFIEMLLDLKCVGILVNNFIILGDEI